MINWAKYFDKIVCVCYNKNIKRKLLLEYELKRVGILDSGIFSYQITFQNTFIKKFTLLNEKDTLYFNSEATFCPLNCARISGILGHLDIIKKAYYEGCNRILIILDDVRFLKDLNFVEDILLNIPDLKEWDLLTFDKFIHNYINFFNTIKNKKYVVNKHFCKFDSLLSAACYCVNRHGMEVMMSVQDSSIFNITDFIFCYTSLKKYWKKLFSIKSMIAQVMFSKTASIFVTTEKERAILLFLHVYKNQELNFDLYMMRTDGSHYDYGDYIDD